MGILDTPVHVIRNGGMVVLPDSGVLPVAGAPSFETVEHVITTAYDSYSLLKETKGLFNRIRVVDLKEKKAIAVILHPTETPGPEMSAFAVEISEEVLLSERQHLVRLIELEMKALIRDGVKKYMDRYPAHAAVMSHRWQSAK